MMKTAPTIMEVRVLISAQLDLLESPEPLTPAQLEELHSRAESIRMLCKEMEELNAASNLPRRRLRPLTEPQEAEAERDLEFAEAA